MKPLSPRMHRYAKRSPTEQERQGASGQRPRKAVHRTPPSPPSPKFGRLPNFQSYRLPANTRRSRPLSKFGSLPNLGEKGRRRGVGPEGAVGRGPDKPTDEKFEELVYDVSFGKRGHMRLPAWLSGDDPRVMRLLAAMGGRTANSTIPNAIRTPGRTTRQFVYFLASTRIGLFPAIGAIWGSLVHPRAYKTAPQTTQSWRHSLS